MEFFEKDMFLSNQGICKPGPTIEEFYFSVALINSATPLFFGEVIETDKFNGDSLVLISNAGELQRFIEECPLHCLWCFVPRCLSSSDDFELHRLLSVERALIQPNGEDQPIYKLKLKNGMDIFYDLADTEFPAETLVFEPYISYLLTQSSRSTACQAVN